MTLEAEQKVFKDYEERERWWRSTLKNTPVPGTYQHHDFLYDLDAVPIAKTYGFRSSGRKVDADPSRTGHYLMPGLYKHEGFIEQSQKKPATYNFKATDRNTISSAMCGMIAMGNAKTKISPTTYDKGFVPMQKARVSDPSFKSQSARFPTIYFQPKKGPGPGHYDIHKESEVNKCRAQTSPFKSKTPRFLKPHMQKTPGPGAYTRLQQFPMPPHIKYIGRYHGLFFPPGVS